ncbi:hypothetical protein CBR_g36297 [Chara braunii]|uniref:C2 domain-containing protein n=1 Tax=Chara braunii TaxID=69332 RepID=A0A388LKG4_CHABU|nr:hypothetical protein CBR_g36297 [Chara braunii]|eukprot:GBG82767.1 hypothetical protein CBR_g36297 [Chara braunii]
MTAKGGKSGWLKVTVVEGRALKDTGFVGLQSPYVIVKVGKEERRSKTHKSGGVSPQWNEELDSIRLNNTDEHPTLQVSVLNEAFLLKDDHIGATQIPLADVYELGVVENSFSLRTTTDRLRGSISLIIRFDEDAPQRSFISQPASVSEGVSSITSPPTSVSSSGSPAHQLASAGPQADALYPPRPTSFPRTDSGPSSLSSSGPPSSQYPSTTTASPDEAYPFAQVAPSERVCAIPPGPPGQYRPSSQDAAYSAATGPPLTGGAGESSSHRGLGICAPALSGAHPSASAQSAGLPSYVSDPSRQSQHLPPSPAPMYPPTGPMPSTTGPPPSSPVYPPPAAQSGAVRQPSPPAYPPSAPVQSTPPHSSPYPPPVALQSTTVAPSSSAQPGYPPAQPAPSPITTHQPHPAVALHSSGPPHSASPSPYFPEGSRQDRNQHLSSAMGAIYTPTGVPSAAAPPQLQPAPSTYPHQAYGYHPGPTGSSSSGVGALAGPQHSLSMRGSGYTSAVENYQGPVAGPPVTRAQTLPSHPTAGVQAITAPSLESLQISAPAARPPSTGQQPSAREDSRAGSLGASRPALVSSSSMVSSMSMSSSISGPKSQRAWNDTDDEEQVVAPAQNPPPPPPAAVAEKVSSPKRQLGGSSSQLASSGDPNALRRHASPPQSVYGRTMAAPSAPNAESSQPYGAPLQVDPMTTWRPRLPDASTGYGGHTALPGRSAESVMGYPQQPTVTSSGRTAQPVPSAYGHVAQSPTLPDGSSPYPSSVTPALYGGHAPQSHPADLGMGYPPSVSTSDPNVARRHAQAAPPAYGHLMQTPPPDGHLPYAPVASLTSPDPNATRQQAQTVPSSYGQNAQGPHTDSHLSTTHPTAGPLTSHQIPHGSSGACWNEYAPEPPQKPPNLNSSAGCWSEYTPGDAGYHLGSGGGGDQAFPPPRNTAGDNRYAPKVAAASSYSHSATYSAPAGRYPPQDVPPSSPPVPSYGHVSEYAHAPGRMDAPPIPVQTAYHSSTLSDVHVGGGVSQPLYPPQPADALDRGQPVHGGGRSSSSMTDAAQALQQQRYSMPAYQGYGSAGGGAYASAQSWDSHGNNPSYPPPQSHGSSSLGRSPSGGASKSHSD